MITYEKYGQSKDQQLLKKKKKNKPTFQNYSPYCHNHRSQFYWGKKAVRGIEGPYTYNAAIKSVPDV